MKKTISLILTVLLLAAGILAVVFSLGFFAG